MYKTSAKHGLANPFASVILSEAKNHYLEDLFDMVCTPGAYASDEILRFAQNDKGEMAIKIGHRIPFVHEQNVRLTIDNLQPTTGAKRWNL
jgi:hypothetical protein